MKLSMAILQFPFDFSSERFYVSHNWSSPLSIEVETIWFCFGFQAHHSSEILSLFQLMTLCSLDMTNSLTPSYNSLQESWKK